MKDVSDKPLFSCQGITIFVPLAVTPETDKFSDLNNPLNEASPFRKPFP